MLTGLRPSRRTHNWQWRCYLWKHALPNRRAKAYRLVTSRSHSPTRASRRQQERESIAHSYGLQAYAEVMNRFAAGERLNRVWSASTDGYIEEAHRYIERATRQFAETLEAFNEVKSHPPSRGSA